MRDTCKCKIVWRDRERSKETIETVETGDTCRYKIVWRDRERLKRLWRREILAGTKLCGETERD